MDLVDRALPPRLVMRAKREVLRRFSLFANGVPLDREAGCVDMTDCETAILRPVQNGQRTPRSVRERTWAGMVVVRINAAQVGEMFTDPDLPRAGPDPLRPDPDAAI